MVETNEYNITVYDFAVKLKEKIKNYKGGGIKGVWENIDPRFKQKVNFEDGTVPYKVKSPKDDITIVEDNFRKQVRRLDNKNLKNVPMQLGLGKGKGNILLLMNVLEILEIRSISDLLDTSFRKPSADEYIVDSNIRIKRTQKKLNEISKTMQIIMTKKTRFTAKRVSSDWLAVLIDINNFIDPPENNNMQDIVEKSIRLQMPSIIPCTTDKSTQFALGFCAIQREYRQYFFNDVLLHYYNEKLSKSDKEKYDSYDKIIILSPLYALYFLALMYKRYMYYLGNEIRDERNKKFRVGLKKADNNIERLSKYSFISDANFDTNRKKILEGKELGEYIYDKIVSLNNLLKLIIKTSMRPYTRLIMEKFQDYYEIFKETFYLFYSMNFDNTTTNQDWLDRITPKIRNLDELYKLMALGISNICQPTINHIQTLSNIIQNLKNIADIINNESR